MQLRVHRIGDANRVGTRRQEYSGGRGVLGVDQRMQGVVASAQLHPRYVGQACDLAVHAVFHYDVTELLLAAQTAKHIDGDQEIGVFR